MSDAEDIATILAKISDIKTELEYKYGIIIVTDARVEVALAECDIALTEQKLWPLKKEWQFHVPKFDGTHDYEALTTTEIIEIKNESYCAIGLGLITTDILAFQQPVTPSTEDAYLELYNQKSLMTGSQYMLSTYSNEIYLKYDEKRVAALADINLLEPLLTLAYQKRDAQKEIAEG